MVTLNQLKTVERRSATEESPSTCAVLGDLRLQVLKKLHDLPGCCARTPTTKSNTHIASMLCPPCDPILEDNWGEVFSIDTIQTASACRTYPRNTQRAAQEPQMWGKGEGVGDQHDNLKRQTPSCAPSAPNVGNVAMTTCADYIHLSINPVTFENGPLRNYLTTRCICQMVRAPRTGGCVPSYP